MDNSFLQSFLKTGLFDIEDNDERLKNLQQSIGDLQKKFEKDKTMLPKYTLVALDPNISDTEPALIQTEGIVTKYWQTLRTKYPEMPRNILRGVILNALYNVAIVDPISARTIFLTATNFFPYAKLNTEKKWVEAMLNELGEIAEKNAIEEWSLIEKEPSLKLSALKVTDFKFGAFELDKKALEGDMYAAVQNDSSGYGTQHGGNSQWGTHFANKSAGGIAKSFKTAMDEFNKSLSPSSLETPINNFFAEFKKTLNENLKASFSSLTALERRSKLLWWKETLYSSSLKGSYRGLNKNLLPIIMGSDLYNQVPLVTPVSVDYLLRDTLLLLNERKDDSIKFKDYLVAISDNSTKPILKQYFTHLNECEGRISLTNFIGLLVNDKWDFKDFQSKTGIGENEEIAPTELSVAVLHNLLTQRLTSK